MNLCESMHELERGDRRTLNKLFEKLFGTAEAPTYDVTTMVAMARSRLN
ncbi:MAG: hypothetical protein HC866_07420 [Leptolyngbyaceae cyanobacterium RU_5_1]|nr:hypothetical protein [Leptolyngbyaceae cyanobacterium RU_5_1]